MIELLDPTDISIIFDKLCDVMEEKVNYVFASYAKAIVDSLDPIKLPSLKYGVIGGYGYFDLKLKPIAAYENLRSKLFQCLREIGNSISFIHLLEQVTEEEHYWDFNVSAFFGGIRPTTDLKMVHRPHEFATILKDAISNDVPSRKELVRWRSFWHSHPCC